jgi:hypothetical protein
MRGLTALTSSYESFSRAIACGRMLYTSTSERFASARHASRAVAFFRSSAMLRLLRFALRKI